MARHQLRIIREELGMVQGDVAEKCGVSTSTVSKWELGKLDIPEEKVALLASALSVSEDLIHELRGAPDDNPINGFVCSYGDIASWVLAIAESDEPAEVRSVLIGLPLYIDKKSWLSVFELGELSGRMNLRREFVEKHLKKALQTDFVERVNPTVEYVVRLRFPTTSKR